MHKLNPFIIIFDLIKHRFLIKQLTKRDLLSQYRGSYLGIGWSFLYPLLLLCGYTLVFSGVFGGRWGQNKGSANGIELALFIYCGLVVFFPLSEVLTNTPRILLSHQNFVKKIIFPTQILPLISTLSASIRGGAHVLLLVCAAFLTGHVHPSVLLVPVILFPAWLIMLGLAWFMAAVGAYVRDLAHGMPIFMQLMMFLLPVFYPSAAAPDPLRALHNIDPLSQTIDGVRRVILEGSRPDWHIWWITLIAGFIFAFLGYIFFMQCKEEFADVL